MTQVKYISLKPCDILEAPTFELTRDILKPKYKTFARSILLLLVFKDLWNKAKLFQAKL